MDTKENGLGYGRPEMVEVFQELVEATPQIPIDKIGHFAKVGLTKIKDSVQAAWQENESLPQAKPKRGV